MEEGKACDEEKKRKIAKEVLKAAKAAKKEKKLQYVEKLKESRANKSEEEGPFRSAK